MEPAAADVIDFTPVVAGRQRTICCHRGQFSGRFPANSLASVRECVAGGAARLEIDVRFLADDGKLIFHGKELEHETTGSGRVDALSSEAARAICYRTPDAGGLCFLNEIVAALKDAPTRLQVDLKLMRPISPQRVQLLADTLAPLRDRVVIGSQAHWNLRPFRALGFPVGLDPRLHWYYEPDRPAESIPTRLGVHGLWDDSPLAHIKYATACEYFEARTEDLLGLLPGAVEWMVDVHTLRHMAKFGFELGKQLAPRGVELAAWTLRDAGRDATTQTLAEMFALGATTIIADDAPAVARYASALRSL
jgi:glycerophosphoryl diester phosphodiesterase